MASRFATGWMLTVSLVALAGNVQAQSRNNEAIAVCEAQRAPFVQIRERNREQIVGRTAVGLLGGALVGGALGAAATQNQSKDTQRSAMIAGAVLGAAAGGINEYLDAKRQISQDNREIARMIDSEARGHAGAVGALANSINSIGACRENQINTWEQRLIATRTEFVRREQARAAALAAAPDDRTRRNVERDNRKAAQADNRVLEQMGREEQQIRLAISDDKKLFDDVLQFYDNDIIAMAEAQARVQGTSPASLRGPAEAYTVQVIPPAIMASQSAFGGTGSAFGGSSPARTFTPPPPAPPAGPPPSYVQQATPLREIATAQGRVITSLPAGTAVQLTGSPVGLFQPVTYQGRTGFVLTARLTSTPPAGIRTAVAPPPPPPWRAQIQRTQFTPTNGHQAALVAQRDAAATANATTQTGQARLQYAVQRGNEVVVGP